MEWQPLLSAGEPFAGSAFDEPVYRIPALAVSRTGRVLAACDVRADWRDLPGDFDVVLRHSDDHGHTWSPPRVLRSHSSGHGFGDASLIADPATGRLLCWYVGSTGRSFFSAEPGRGAPGLELWLATSDDDGQTWTHRDMTALRPDDVGGMFASSGNGAALASGRLLQPFVLRRGEQHFAAVARSDDGGDTWQLGEPVGPDCDESKVLGLRGDEVLLHARATPLRRAARSTDGGVTFAPAEPDAVLTDPACNGGLVVLGEHVVCSILDDPHQRRRLALRTSGDQGRTWSPPLLADAGACAYSVLATLADGALGLAWEGGDYESILFARITAADLGLTGTPPTLTPRAGAPGSARPPEVAD